MKSDGAAEAISEISSRLTEPTIRLPEISDLLDGWTHTQRVAAVRSLGRAQQRNLYRAADGFRPLRLEHLVPPSQPDFTPVRHFGKNTLPAFTHFEKRFCRPPGEDSVKPSELYGFNFQTMSAVTGPGYFVAREDTQRAEVLVDYNFVPPQHPDGWPPIRGNEGGLSRFVYGFMIDTLRGISEHVSIGSAARKGKDLGSWFILCREA
jgi:hypothetical protein